MLSPRARTPMAIGIVLVLVGLADPVAGARASAIDWAQFHNTADHDGYNSRETVLGPGNVSGLQLKWTATLTGLGSVETSPAVVNGAVYVGVYQGQGDENRFYKLDATTGGVIWKSRASRGGFDCAPAVWHGLVFVCTTSNDPMLLALSTTDGTPVWTMPFPHQYFTSGPVVSGDTLYVSRADGVAQALDPSSGTVLWSTQFDSSAEDSPAVSEGSVFVVSTLGVVHQLDALTGVEGWATDITGLVDSTPAVAHGTVYVGGYTTKSLFALDAGTGQIKWVRATNEFIDSSPAVANGIVYVGSRDTNLYAFSAKDGTRLWASPTGNDIFSSPAVANGVVYVGSQDSRLHAFDAITGAELFESAQLSGLVDTSPAVVNGMVYVGTAFGFPANVYAFGL